MATDAAQATTSPPPIDLSVPNLDQAKLLQLISSVPGIFPRVISAETGKEDAAQALSNLSSLSNPAFLSAMAAAAAAGHLPFPPPVGGEPGPSSHPRGPPRNLEELTAAAQSAAPAANASNDEDGDDGDEGKPAPTTATGGRRSRGGAAMGSEEWQRIRKDNHKEVERRRRGNINEGINELGRIVPNGSGEKSKGAILARAVQYIHHLKENEARNIEKWTLEKLLMDQAMGDLQNQLEEVRRLWEEERTSRQNIEAELEALRGTSDGAKTTAKTSGVKRSNDEVDGNDDNPKKQRTE